MKKGPKIPRGALHLLFSLLLLLPQRGEAYEEEEEEMDAFRDAHGNSKKKAASSESVREALLSYEL